MISICYEAKGGAMLSKLIVIANLNHFKFLICKIDSTGKESLQLEKSSDSILIYQSEFQSNYESDFSVDFHLSEKERCCRIQEIADEIENALEPHKHKAWYFIVPKVINEQVVEILRSAMTECMVVNLYADLTKMLEHELLEHCKVLLAQKHKALAL
jgi:hypothetical protein